MSRESVGNDFEVRVYVEDKRIIVKDKFILRFRPFLKDMCQRLEREFPNNYTEIPYPATNDQYLHENLSYSIDHNRVILSFEGENEKNQIMHSLRNFVEQHLSIPFRDLVDYDLVEEEY